MRLTSNAGRNHAALWGNSRTPAEVVVCSRLVAAVDHVCGGGYVDGCGNSSGKLGDSPVIGGAALTDR